MILPIKVVASDVGQWKVPLQQARDPVFFMPLVLYVFAKSFFSLWQGAAAAAVLSLRARAPHSLPSAAARRLADKGSAELRRCLILTAGGRSSVSVLAT